MKPNSDIVNGGFLSQHFMIDSFKKKVIDENTTGAGVPRIVLSNFKNVYIKFPKLDEQKQIVCYLENIDNLITLHQWKQKTTEVNFKHQKHSEIIFINI